MGIKKYFSILIVTFICFINNNLFAQELYTAKAYWAEANKGSYKKLNQKKLKGDSLSQDETSYLKDYETYLANYYQRMPEEEQRKYEIMKFEWNGERAAPKQPDQNDFEWRAKDRFRNGIYGLYYGISLTEILKINSAGSAGIPLIMAGLWQLGPVINPKKYEGITVSTIRAGNSGKILGLGYGLALGLALGGDSESTGDLALGLSTVGSITLGELAFQSQKKEQWSEGHIELMRHYGFLGPGVGLLGYIASNSQSSNTAGASLLAGGIAGLIVGNSAAKKYEYTSGDVDAIKSLTWLYTGLGFSFVGSTLEQSNALNNSSSSLALIPAATAIAGTIIGQRMVRGVHLTKRQGSTINLASGGAALIGLGIVSLTESGSPVVWIGVPSVLGLITHQIIFHKYKMKNLEKEIHLGSNGKHPIQFSMKVMPENYFISTKTINPFNIVNGSPVISNPLLKLNFTF
jgi:hypothetical protein